MKNFKGHPGILEFEAPQDLESGQLFKVEHYVGVIANDVDEGETAVMDYLGQFEAPKADAAGAVDVGEPVFLDETEDGGVFTYEVTDTDDTGDNLYIGLAHEDATAGASLINVDLAGMALHAEAVLGSGT